jgi:hypothetical protein
MVRIRDALISVASIGILIALLAITDERVRERLTGLTPGAVSHQLADGRGHLRTAGAVAHDLIVDSGPLTTLVIAGTVLFVFMLRT